MKSIINYLFNIFGYEIKKKRKSNNLLSDESLELIQIVRNHTMLPYVRLSSLYEQVLFCEENNVIGDFVECGTWKGGAVGLMALVNLKHGKKRRTIHLFDAFTEICQPNIKDDGERAIKEVKARAKENVGFDGKLVPMYGVYDHKGGPGTLEDNKMLLENIISYDKNFLHYHQGWFQDTIPKASKQIGKIAILRLDADWYASTKICLDYFFDKVVPGGFIIIDDYGAYNGCKKAVDEFLEKKSMKFYLNSIDSEAKYLIKIT